MNVIDSANHLFRAHKLQYGTNSNGSPEYIGIFMARECRSPVTHIHWYCSLSSARRAMARIRDTDRKLFDFICSMRTVSFEGAANFIGTYQPYQPVFSEDNGFAMHMVPQSKRYPVDFYREDTGPRPGRKSKAETNDLFNREEKSKIFRQQRTYSDGKEIVALVKQAVEAGEYTVMPQEPLSGKAHVKTQSFKRLCEPVREEQPFWADRKSDHFDPIEAQTWQELFTDKALRALR